MTDAAGREGELKRAFEEYQPQERSLEPYGKPEDIPHGEKLIARATVDWDKARGDLDEVQKRKEALSGELTATKRLIDDFATVRESLSAIISPALDHEAGPFRETVDAARVRRDDIRETLSEAVRLLEDATREVRRTADLLARHATDARFEKVAAPVRRQMISTDREQLPDYATDWETALRPRFRVLSDELEQIERHRAMLVERLQGMVKHALGRLRAAQKASRLPADLGDWSGLEFLRISFTPPDDAVLAERLGQVIDDATAVSAGKEPGKLAQHATDERFEKVAAPVRRQMISTDRERLPDFAADWETALRPRFRVLSDELQQIERHRAMLVERLQGMVKHALGRLRAAQRASKLPADLGDWSGLEFLRISFTPPDDAVLAERLGQVIDEVTAASAGMEPSKRDGLSLLLSGVRAALRPKGVRVEMLKPDAVLRDERVRVAEISDVFSGGQLLTAAIILYCTMAWLRAGERGQAQRQHAGVLFLDNPIGRASAGYLLELQLTVAKKLGVQLVYTTGLFDLNALSVFPLIIRLRNDADLRAGMKYLRVDDEIRTRLPDPVADDTGVLTVSRLFVRADAQAP